jgi:response regulator RpfG family c-di-GMP phosphodiesterase
MPFPNDLVQYLKALANQAGLVLRNLLYADDLRSSREEAVKNFVTTSEYHDKDTGGHIDRMSRYSELLFKIVGKNEEDCAKIRFASMLHDIGKISTPDRVLKKPGSLNDEEWTIMKKHANAGYEMLCDSSCEYLKMGAVIALTHHERWDGSGYPRGLKGEEIPLEGRVVALADVFDALCSKRCYKDAWPLTKVIGLIEDASGSHFDPTLVKVFVDNIDAFLEIKATFPTGPVNKEQYKDENKVNLTAKVS